MQLFFASAEEIIRFMHTAANGCVVTVVNTLLICNSDFHSNLEFTNILFPYKLYFITYHFNIFMRFTTICIILSQPYRAEMSQDIANTHRKRRRASAMIRVSFRTQSLFSSSRLYSTANLALLMSYLRNANL
jgi:hypothetical protein